MSDYPYQAEHALPQDPTSLDDIFASQLFPHDFSPYTEQPSHQGNGVPIQYTQPLHGQIVPCERADSLEKYSHDDAQFDRLEVRRTTEQNLYTSRDNMLHDSRYSVASLCEPQNTAEMSRIDNQFQRAGKTDELAQSPAVFQCEANQSSLSFPPDHSATPMRPISDVESCHESPHQEAQGEMKYPPFQGRFLSSEDAKRYRRMATRFGRKPYRPPDSDPSIAAIEAERQVHVERIYNAMIRSDLARDNNNSIARKRWAVQKHYEESLVEAFAHKVFDSLLEQAKEGFRGWRHNDYVVDERKGEDEDRDVSCAARLDNIVFALEYEKTICEDVMNSACQIRMFVNAPKAYANRKHQNRVGNSKRGRTKDTPEPPSAKRLKLASNRPTRDRSSTTSDIPTAQHSLQHIHPQPAASVPTRTPQIAHNYPNAAMSPVSHQYPSVQQRLTSVTSNPISPDRNTGASFSPLSSNAQPHRNQSLPPQPPTHLSSSSLRTHIHSATSSPDNRQIVTGAPNLHPWQFTSHVQQLVPSQAPMPVGDELGHIGMWNSGELYDTHTYVGSANLFEEHPEAAATHREPEMIPERPSTHDASHAPNFLQFWDSQSGVQPMPYDDSPVDFKFDS